MAAITIYGTPISTFVRTVRMQCEEKGLVYDLVPHMMHSPEMNALHPFGKVPAAKFDDFLVTETSAICGYIEAAFKGQSLLPADPKGHARVEEWMSRIGDSIYDGVIRRYVLAYVFPGTPDGKPNRKAIDAAIPGVQKIAQHLDQRLTGASYLSEGKLTLADLFLAPIMFYLGQMPEGSDILKPHKALQAWKRAIEARPSFQKTMPPSGG